MTLRSIDGWKATSNWSTVLTQGKRGLLEPAFDAVLIATPPLDVERLGEKRLVVEVGLAGLLADRVELRLQMLHFQPGAQAEGTIGEFFREMARPASTIVRFPTASRDVP